MTINKPIKPAVAENAAVAKALKTAGNSLSNLQYIQTELSSNTTRNRTEEASGVALEAVTDSIFVAQYATKKRTELMDKLWDGTITSEDMLMLEPGYFNFQDSLAQKALQELSESMRSEKLSNVVMVYDVNDKSEFVRGYMSNDQPLDPNHEDDQKVIRVIDQTFHSWLVSNGLSSQDGVIYTTDQLDKQGNPINRADPHVISALLRDPVKGLESVMKKQDRTYALDVRQYQAKKPVEKPSAEVESTSVKATNVAQPTVRAETPTPDTGPGAAA